MKKLKRYSIFFSTLILGIFFTLHFTNVATFADSGYSINQYLGALKVSQNNNEAQFTQTISYSFNESHNGVYVSLAKTSNAESGFQISVKKVEINKGNGWENVSTNNYPYYEMENTNSQIRIKLYNHIDYGSLKVRVTWDLKNLFISNKDVDELNWFPITNWDVSLQNVSIGIQLPKSNIKLLKTWVHTNTGINGNVEINKNKGQILITAPNIPAGQKLEIHSYWNKNVTNFPIVHNILKANKINIQESKITFKSHLKMGIVLLITFVLSPILLIFGIIKLLINIHSIKKEYKKGQQLAGVNKPVVHIYDIPNNLAPAEIAARLNPAVNEYPSADKSNLISATLMDLVSRKFITINNDSKNPIFYLKSQNPNQLKRYEQILINMLFLNDETFNPKTLKKPYSKVSKKIRSSINNFLSVLSNEVEDPIVDNKATKKASEKLSKSINTFWILSIFSLGFLLILSLIFKLTWIWATLVLFGLIVFIVGLLANRVKTLFYTTSGFQEEYNWRGFESMLNDIAKLDTKNIPDIQLWDRILVYAIIFNQATKVSRVLRSKIPKNDIDALQTPVLFNYYYNYWYFNDMSSSLTNTAIKTPQSSFGNWSGDGGGFSSGGGFSGGSGGGGGGAF